MQTSFRIRSSMKNLDECLGVPVFIDSVNWVNQLTSLRLILLTCKMENIIISSFRITGRIQLNKIMYVQESLYN